MIHVLIHVHTMTPRTPDFLLCEIDIIWSMLTISVLEKYTRGKYVIFFYLYAFFVRLVLSIVDGVDQLSREKWQFIHLVLSIKLKYGWLARDITNDSPNNSKINLNPFLITFINPLQHRRAPPHFCSASFPYQNFYFTNLSVCLLDILLCFWFKF